MTTRNVEIDCKVEILRPIKLWRVICFLRSDRTSVWVNYNHIHSSFFQININNILLLKENFKISYHCIKNFIFNRAFEHFSLFGIVIKEPFPEVNVIFKVTFENFEYSKLFAFIENFDCELIILFLYLFSNEDFLIYQYSTYELFGVIFFLPFSGLLFLILLTMLPIINRKRFCFLQSTLWSFSHSTLHRNWFILRLLVIAWLGWISTLGRLSWFICCHLLLGFHFWI